MELRQLNNNNNEIGLVLQINKGENMAKDLQIKQHDLYLLKISLKEIIPPIWRRILVPADFTLPQLHLVIQSVMGWWNEHLHHFEKGKICYCDYETADSRNDIIYDHIILRKVLPKVRSKMIYTYDFGDSWRHEIILEKILKEQKQSEPSCLDGERACPPEDSGGVWGYQFKLEVIADPKHEEYQDILEWLGDDYDPEKFSVEEVNDRLKYKDYGCQTPFDF